VNAFVCLEALAGKEVATVLSQYKVNDKVIIAMDTDPDTLEWVPQRRDCGNHLAEAVHNDLRRIAGTGQSLSSQVEFAHQDWSKDSFAPVPAFVDTGSALVDKSNVENFIQMKQAATGGVK